MSYERNVIKENATKHHKIIGGTPLPITSLVAVAYHGPVSSDQDLQFIVLRTLLK